VGPSFARPLWCFVPLIACASPAAQDAQRKPLHDSCLHSCRNVRKIPRCPAEIPSAPNHSPAEVVGLASQLAGQHVRIGGRLGKGEGNWTQINCPKDVCCSQQLDPFVSLYEATSELALAGEFRLPNGTREKLLCGSRGGAMVKTYGSSPGTTFAFELWNRRRDGEPDPATLERAYCCNLDARGQRVIVEATLQLSELVASPHRLVDPMVCELDD
jgi:hypothetical protein